MSSTLYTVPAPRLFRPQVLAAAQAEAERVVAEAREAAAQTRATAEGSVVALAARVTALLTLHDEFSRSVDAVRELYDEFDRSVDAARTRHAEMLTAVTQLRVDARRRVLPLLEDSQRVLRGEPDEIGEPEESRGTQADGGAPSQIPAGAPGDVNGALSVPAPSGLPATAVPGNGGGIRADAEIVVGPFTSFLDVTKFLTALSRLAEVRSARIRTFSQGMATLDVALAGGAWLDISRIEGYPLDVVEREGTRLVLRRPEVREAP